jgi:abortive infection bacteriophage resistance protein
LAKIPFAKPALPLADQLELLRNRGLIINNDEMAQKYLENISYYRFSGYTRYFSDNLDDRRERFRADVKFEDVVGLYVFDRRLRVLLSEAFERIEVAVKGGIAYHGSIVSGPFWITDPTNFDANRHQDIMRLVSDAIAPVGGKHKQVFLDHFFRKYENRFPPAWMLTEVLSFHGASMVFKLARGPVRIPISAQFQIQQDVLESWLHALVFARNVCAHHGRFWNRRFTIKPKIPNIYKDTWPQASQDRLYITCCIVHHLLLKLGGETSWPIRLRALIDERPNVPLSDMGFPPDWEQKAFWGF